MKSRLIGNYLPIDKIGKISVNESKIHKGVIASFHMWAARRPMAVSRYTSYAALVDDNETNRKSLDSTLDLKLKETKKNHDDNKIHNGLKKIITDKYGQNIPKILDPFGGGGSIPMANMQLGCETYTNDYNPVSYIIQLCSLYYPQKYGKDKIINDVNKAIERAKKHITANMSELYTGSEYIWARTIPCNGCKKMIPLLKSYCIDEKNKIYAIPKMNDGKISFKFVQKRGYGKLFENAPDDFDENKLYTVKKMKAFCPWCSVGMDSDDTHKLMCENVGKHEIVCVVKREKHRKKLHEPTIDDKIAYDKCKNILDKKRKEFIKKYEYDPIPEEIINTPHNKEYKHGDPYFVNNSMVRIGITRWKHAYNDRQLLFHLNLLEFMREYYDELIKDTNDKEYANCIISYIALIQDRLATRGQSVFGIWTNKNRFTINGLKNPTFREYTSYSEVHPIDKAGFDTKTKEAMSSLKSFSNGIPAKITCASSTDLPYNNEFFDAVITDPPYYDMIQYADFSDFFYVWLKRSLGHIYPNIFTSPLSPKRHEMVVNNKQVNKSKNVKLKTLKDKKYFEDKMCSSLNEMYRVLKNDGILVLVYAHSSKDGWEALINGVIQTGFTITAAWPINTETPNRMSAQNTKSIHSTLYLVARKIKKKECLIYDDEKNKIEKELYNKLKELESYGYLNESDQQYMAIAHLLKHITQYDIVQKTDGRIISGSDILKETQNFLNKWNRKKEIGLITDSGMKAYVLWHKNYGSRSVSYNDAMLLFRSHNLEIKDYMDYMEDSKGMLRFMTPLEFNDAKKIPRPKDENDTLAIIYNAIRHREKTNAERSISYLFNEMHQDKRRIEDLLDIIPKIINKTNYDTILMITGLLTSVQNSNTNKIQTQLD